MFSLSPGIEEFIFSRDIPEYNETLLTTFFVCTSLFYALPLFDYYVWNVSSKLPSRLGNFLSLENIPAPNRQFVCDWTSKSKDNTKNSAASVPSTAKNRKEASSSSKVVPPVSPAPEIVVENVLPLSARLSTKWSYRVLYLCMFLFLLHLAVFVHDFLSFTLYRFGIIVMLIYYLRRFVEECYLMRNLTASTPVSTVEQIWFLVFHVMVCLMACNGHSLSAPFCLLFTFMCLLMQFAQFWAHNSLEFALEARNKMKHYVNIYRDPNSPFQFIGSPHYTAEIFMAMALVSLQRTTSSLAYLLAVTVRSMTAAKRNQIWIKHRFYNTKKEEGTRDYTEKNPLPKYLLIPYVY